LLLLAIHPRFARMILRGEKTVELRRRAPNRPAGYWIALYSTSPEKALIGLVRAAEVLIDTPEALWQLVKDGCGVGKDDYRRYYSGANRAVGIRLSDPIEFVEPLHLDNLRCFWPRFTPPRSFAYLGNEEVIEVGNRTGVCVLTSTAASAMVARDRTLGDGNGYPGGLAGSIRAASFR
jgi:predicted transcriptional regulator